MVKKIKYKIILIIVLLAIGILMMNVLSVSGFVKGG